MFRKCSELKLKTEQLLSTVDTSDVKLIYYYLPINQNGFSMIRSSKTPRYILGLNLYRKARSPELALFYLYVTLFHEMEHIQLDKTRGQSCSTLTQWYMDAERTTCDTWKYHFTLEAVGTKRRKRARMNRYQTSMNELHCIYHGYINALSHLGRSISATEHEIIEKICESVAFVMRHLEIDYTNRNAPIGKFAYLINRMEKRAKTKRAFSPDSCLTLLYHDNGKRKSLSDLFFLRDGTNFDLIDNLILRLFMYSGVDFTDEFKNNPQLQCHISSLLDDHIRNLAEYITNYPLASVYLSDEVLKDNNAMVIKEIELLQSLAKKYSLEVSTEIITVLK